MNKPRKGRIPNASVTLRPGESLDSALQRFKRKVAMSGCLVKAQEKQFYRNKRELKEFRSKNK